MRPAYEVADVLEVHWDHIDHSKEYNNWQKRTLRALKICRTSELGGHIDSCDSCGHVNLSYNSCRNRHCPKCQGQQREQWIEARTEELLPVKYFHVVFTLPDKLGGLCMAYPKAMYDLLFSTSWNVIKTFSSDPKMLGARTGMFSILHTWGQNLSLHPHLHCVVPAGGLTAEGKWKHTKSDGKFLFPVKAMSKVFRAKFVEGLLALIKERKWRVDKKHIESLFDKPWVVYAKQPFLDTHQVVEYLGRYTHKIAISNHRLKSITNESVSFTWKDYRHGNKKGVMTLQPQEFIRRFAQHILPKGFVRIRHYGILSSTSKKLCLQTAREFLIEGFEKQSEDNATKKENQSVASCASVSSARVCPVCKQKTFRTIAEFDRRGPPQHLLACLTQRVSAVPRQNKQSHK
jgi:hypothetical protein